MPASKTRRSVAGAAGHIRKASQMHQVHKANGHMRTDVLDFFLEIMTGDPERAMEGAKHLIGLPEGEVPAAPLAHIVSDLRYRDWSRIAAAYTLGFLPPEKQGSPQQVLRKVLEDPANSVRVRSHAAEALGNLRDAGATPVLKSRLLDAQESTAVRRWCIYALAEISSLKSRKVLRAFALTRPQGILAAEMNSAYEALQPEVA